VCPGFDAPRGTRLDLRSLARRLPRNWSQNEPQHHSVLAEPQELYKRYPYIVEALIDLSPDTVIDGDVVALDDAGRPSFRGLQHFQAAASRIRYLVFDLLVAQGAQETTTRSETLAAGQSSFMVYSDLTFAAWRPFGPLVTSNSTAWPSFNDL